MYIRVLELWYWKRVWYWIWYFIGSQVKASLEEGKDVRLVDWKLADVEILNTFQLLTAKPVVYLVSKIVEYFSKAKNMEVLVFWSWLLAENILIFSISTIWLVLVCLSWLRYYLLSPRHWKVSKDTLNSHLTSLTELFSREKCLRLSCVILHDLDAEVKSNSIFSLIFLVILRSVCLK